jgi:hypothetical protein
MSRMAIISHYYGGTGNRFSKPAAMISELAVHLTIEPCSVQSQRNRLDLLQELTCIALE